MSLRFTTETGDGIATVALTGTASIEAFSLLAAQAGEESRLRRDRLLLVDLTGVDGTLAFTEQFRLGQVAAAHFGHLARLASLVPVGKITRNSEKVALAMGVQLRVFTSRDEAATWLRSD